MFVHRQLKFVIIFLALMSLGACSSLAVDPPEPEDVNEQVSAHETSTEPATKPEELTAELVYDILLSNIALQRGQIDVATNALARAAQRTENIDLISRAAQMAVVNKQYKQAFTLGQLWISMDEKAPLANIITSLAASLDGEDVAAFDILFAFFEQDRSKINLHFRQVGEVFLSQTIGPAQQKIVAKLVDRYPDKAQGWMVLAGFEQRNNNLTKMQDALAKVLKLQPDDAFAAGYMLNALSDDSAAQISFAEKFLAKNPEANDFHLQYARFLLRNNKEDEALKTLLNLLKNDADNSDVMSLIALLYQSKKNYSEAVKFFRKRISAMPGDNRSRIYLADALMNLKRYDDAKAELGRVKDQDERFASERQMSLVIEQADGLGAALEYLDSLHGNTQAQMVQLIVDRELMLKRADDNPAALKVINDGLLRYPDNNILRYHRALISIEQYDLGSHEKDMRILLERNPQNAHYHNALGYSLLTQSNRLSEAEQLIEKAYSLQPEDPYILDSKGWLEFKKGNNVEALEHLTKAFKLDQDAEIAAHIGEIYWRMGGHEKAREFWKKGEEVDANNEVLMKTRARFLKLPDSNI